MRDLIGMKFGRLIVIGQAERKVKWKVRWECKCDCGKMKVINSTDLTKTKSPTRSCGCIQKERTSAARLTHGNNSSNSAEYRAWTNIKTRCYNPKSGVGNKTYMAKGIKMCERWINSFEMFLSDMGHRPSNKHSIDRFPDRNGNYEPYNCRWATLSEQARNKDRSVLFEAGGMSLILQDWADFSESIKLI